MASFMVGLVQLMSRNENDFSLMTFLLPFGMNIIKGNFIVKPPHIQISKLTFSLVLLSQLVYSTGM